MRKKTNKANYDFGHIGCAPEDLRTKLESLVRDGWEIIRIVDEGPTRGFSFPHNTIYYKRKKTYGAS